MSCFKPKKSKSSSPSPTQMPPSGLPNQLVPRNNNVKHELLLRIPGCKVHLMEKGEALFLAAGDLELVRISDNGVSVATIMRVDNELQWPLTKDEPVVKIDALHYLFSLPMKDGNALSYGVTFSQQNAGNLALLDSSLKEHALLTASALSAKNKGIDWQEFAPRVDDYNNVLARAIAGGTGQIVKGIFKCSNAYANQVQKGGEMILIQQAEGKHHFSAAESTRTKNINPTEKNAINTSLKRVRGLSKMIEKMSKALLDVVGIATGSVMVPIVRSKAGQTFLTTMVPGEVLLASLDAVNKIIDAAEAAEKQALSATSGVVASMVTQRFGEKAGEATEDTLAIAGHCFGTARNVSDIRKTITPASTASSGIPKNAPKTSTGRMVPSLQNPVRTCNTSSLRYNHTSYPTCKTLKKFLCWLM